MIGLIIGLVLLVISMILKIEFLAYLGTGFIIGGLSVELFKH